MPAYSGCGYNYFNTNSWKPSWTLSAGVYCNGLSISNGATATMNPGVHFIDRGRFALGGGAHVTGSGVTIVLTSSTFAGGTALNFTGVVYVPTQTLNWNNGANNTTSRCTELIAAKIVLGGANLQINCPAGVAAIGATNSSLAE